MTGSPRHAAVRLDAVTVRRDRQVTLAPATLELPAGELVAIAGGSGAGKTTMLEVMAGLRVPSTGVASIGPGGVPAHELAGSGRIGVVPQDDIVHRELPLRRTLLHAARLRIDPDEPGDVERKVDEVLDRLDLSSRSGVRVGSLSGGQRKRASIAVELLTRPEVLFLDEPTSGLDPLSAAEVVSTLRALVRDGVTVVMTTHDPAQIEACDRVVFLAPDGHLAFVGPPADAPRHFGADDLVGVYHAMAAAPSPAAWSRRWDRRHGAGGGRAGADRVWATDDRTTTRGGVVGGVRQWSVLTRRSAEVVVGNRLTLAVLLGSPALVIAMMAVLFRPGEFGAGGTADGSGAAQTVFWIAFAGFFFGLTFGLLQIVGERAILRREAFGGVRPSAYLGSKVTFLLPVLVVVAVALLAVLRLLDRLPDAGWTVYGALLLTMVLESLAGLLLGLAASAMVADPAQATLALPMLCFPQVLFAGAVVPVDEMAGPGRFLSIGMVTRWAFEALGRSLDLGSGAAAQAAPHASAFTGSAMAGWAALVTLAAVAAVGAMAVLRRSGHRSRT